MSKNKKFCTFVSFKRWLTDFKQEECEDCQGYGNIECHCGDEVKYEKCDDCDGEAFVYDFNNDFLNKSEMKSEYNKQCLADQKKLNDFNISNLV